LPKSKPKPSVTAAAATDAPPTAVAVVPTEPFEPERVTRSAHLRQRQRSIRTRTRSAHRSVAAVDADALLAAGRRGAVDPDALLVGARHARRFPHPHRRDRHGVLLPGWMH
jgi:hypothetical protein